jgi:hypothetical protein
MFTSDLQFRMPDLATTFTEARVHTPCRRQRNVRNINSVAILHTTWLADTAAVAAVAHVEEDVLILGRVCELCLAGCA